MLLIVGVKPSKVKQVAWILSPFPLLVHFGIEYIGVLSLKNTKKIESIRKAGGTDQKLWG